MGFWSPWMASPLITTNSIVVTTTGLSNKDAPRTRRYNFRNYLDKHVKILSDNGHTLSSETIVTANERFEGIEEQLPKRISMPFVAYKILEKIVRSAEEKFISNYF